MVTTVLALAALTLLAVAAWYDVRTRRIPNWAPLGIAALYPLYVVASPVAIAWPWALALAALLFLLGFLAFHFGIMGGGDVKLLSALMLWAGAEHGLAFLFLTAIAGGGLALFTIWYRSMGYAVLAPFAVAGARLMRLASGRPDDGPEREPEAEGGRVAGAARGASLPYGVAIAVGGFVVLRKLAGF